MKEQEARSKFSVVTRFFLDHLESVFLRSVLAGLYTIQGFVVGGHFYILGKYANEDDCGYCPVAHN